MNTNSKDSKDNKTVTEDSQWKSCWFLGG